MAGRNTYRRKGPASGDWVAGNKPPRPYRSRYARVDFTGAISVLTQLGEVAIDESWNMMVKASEMGEENMKRLIQQRGTPFSSIAASQGLNKGPGRVRTGTMLDSVSSRVEAGPKRIYASFGWIKNFEQYFSYQETGFRNLWYALKSKNGRLWYKNGRLGVGKRRTPIWTPGMFALWDSRIRVKTHMSKLVSDTEQKIVKRINK